MPSYTALESLAAVVIFLVSHVRAQQAEQVPYLNRSLTAHARAVDLVGRMNLNEKVSQMGNASDAIPRLGVPAYNWWNEGLHGVARAGYATMFPQAIGMAATWDPPLLREIGDAIATEARAKNNEALRHGNHGIYFGLTFWSPNINIFRDPRWGRGQETYGEDPYLTAQMAVNFIRGLQGDDPAYFKVIATPKHFAVHSGPEIDRHRFNVSPSPHDLWETYLPQFRAAVVDAKADSIMCAYNALDGVPACGNTMLLRDVLRLDWGFNGYVTSDCGAIDDFFRPGTHATEPDAEHADRDALLAGTDTNCGGTYARLLFAVRKGLVKEADLDASLTRLVEARMRLGQFDPPEKVAYARIPFSEVHSAAHAALAKRAAEESLVLLKNDGVLPLMPGKYKTVAVIGPNATSLAALEGNYNGTPHDPVLPVDALKAALPGVTVLYAQGAPYVEGFQTPVPRTMLLPAAGSAEHGLKAEYFGSASLDGVPVRTAVDPQIDFDWSNVNPLPGSPESGFAVRWTGTIGAPRAGDYAFSVRAGMCEQCARQQSVRLVVDGVELIPLRPAAPNDLPRFTLHFGEGQQHQVEIDFVRPHAEQGSGVTLEWTPAAETLLPEALAAAAKADLVIAMLGLLPDLEGEEMPVAVPGFAGGDRTDIALPASQERLLEELAATDKPLVVVLMNGSALAVNFAQGHAKAVLEAWYPGEAGARAIADALTGAVNPSGRLPVTFYALNKDLPEFSDYSMKNRTYRYFTGAPLYRFGFGLSYTRFHYGALRLSANTVKAGATLTATVNVKNTGARAGEEVAELYLIPPRAGNGGLSPRLHLQGVQRVSLRPGEIRTLTFALDPRGMSEVDAQGMRSVQAGTYGLAIGGAQPGDPMAVEPAQMVRFTVAGSQELPR